MNFNDVEQAREALHKKYRKTLIISTLVAITVVATFALFVMQSSKGPSMHMVFLIFPVFFAFVVILIITNFATRKQAEAYRKTYKAYFVEQNLRTTFSGLQYSHDRGIDPRYLSSTRMINTGDRYSSNDFTSGKYKEVAFTQADAHIEVEYTDSDGDTHYSTIFRGRFMIFEFPKKFTFKLELVGNNFHAYCVPGKDSATGRKMEEISTESTEFNRSFKIYGEDGFEAFYILDPAFIVKIQNIYDRYKGKVLLGFINNQLIIALDDGKDSFEPPKFSKPIDEKAELAKIQQDIKIITDFVDQLSLSRELFK